MNVAAEISRAYRVMFKGLCEYEEPKLLQYGVEGSSRLSSFFCRPQIFSILWFIQGVKHQSLFYLISHGVKFQI